VDVAVDGRLMVDPAGGRVVGLVPVLAALVRVAVLVVELVVDFVEAAPVAAGRRVPEVAVAGVRFAAAEPTVAFFSTLGFGEVGVEGTADSDGGADVSVCWTTSKPSASDMMGCVGKAVGTIGRN
jgi:hypothetical protein